MTGSLVKATYRKLVPLRLREDIWHLRHRLFQQGTLSPSVEEPIVAGNSEVNLACDVCEAQKTMTFENASTKKLPYSFYQCDNCKFIFVHPKPVPEETYSDGPVIEMGAGADQFNNYYLDSIEKYAPNRGRILEIGFGDAGFLKIADERGWESHGVELSKNCVEHARNVHGLKHVHLGLLEELRFEDGHYDVIAAFNFIEHIPDLKGTLKELRRLLRPGGLLVLLCPNLEGVYHLLIPQVFGEERDPLGISWVPPYHVSYFNKANFKQLLESNGFNILGDESRGTALLWLQHEVTYGPDATRVLQESLLKDFNDHPEPDKRKKLDVFMPRITELIRHRMVWTMGQSLLELEPELAAENAILYISARND